MNKKILIVDDEKELRHMIKAYLEQEGYQTEIAGNGREALFVARQQKPDLIILDLMMPQMGGYDFIQTYSREADTPIIILTAKVNEMDKVLGLELGADDYVTKPFGMRELVARIRAVLRRTEKAGGDGDQLLQANGIQLDIARKLVTIDQRNIDLTPTEFEILHALMKGGGRVFSRLDLLDQALGTTYEGYERTIDVHVRRLRRKIEPDPKNPRYIETVYGFGYRFAE